MCTIAQKEMLAKIPVAQLEAEIEVYNERLNRWEPERLFDLAASAHLSVALQTTFTHARKERQITVHLG